MKQLKLILALVLTLTACTPGTTPGTTAAGTAPAGTTSPAETTPAQTQASTQAIVTVPIAEGVTTSTEGEFDWRNAAVYYAMTDRFFNGDPANDDSYGRVRTDAKGLDHATFHGGDFKGLTRKISEGYFTDLGINAIWLTAPYEQVHGFVGGGDGEFAHYAFHGYYALDWTMVDRSFGTREEFRQLVDAAHDKGIRIILDVVLNHTGYNTVRDMAEYGFGSFLDETVDGDWQPAEGERYDAYHELIDYQDEASWQKWWGPDWVRAGLPGYQRGGSDDYTMTLAGLPDIITEATEPVALPPVLKTKWARESGADYEPWRLETAGDLRRDLELPPADYISAWLTAWVEEFGIDGFRIDTAKHVERDIWEDLKTSADGALKNWRKANPESPGADFRDDFFMVGEVWGKGLELSEYYDQGFDALINFTFQGDGYEGPAYKPATMAKVFQTYADTLTRQGTNVLSYISSHDTKLFPRKKQLEGVTYLLLLPGALEIFYGDETARPYVSTGRDFTMGTRGDMNWEAIDEEVYDHFKKLGSFRARNLAVGAGRHTQLAQSPLIFQRDYEKNGLANTVIVAMDQVDGAVLDVSTAFADGTLLRDAYTGLGYEVDSGTITVDADPSGLVLLEAVEP